MPSFSKMTYQTAVVIEQNTLKSLGLKSLLQPHNHLSVLNLPSNSLFSKSKFQDFLKLIIDDHKTRSLLKIQSHLAHDSKTL